MSKTISVDVFKKELFDLLEETFERVQGIYLDQSTSLFELLNNISSEDASRPLEANCANIAAQVGHIHFYLDVLFEGCFQHKELGKIDWEESWQTQTVTAEQWEALKQSLKERYHGVLDVLKNLEIWEGEDDIGASLAILAHTAYHIGQIRQSLRLIGKHEFSG